MKKMFVIALAVFLAFGHVAFAQQVSPAPPSVSSQASFSNSAAQLLPHYRLALAKVRNNTGNARIIFYSDSTGAGTGGTGSPVQGTTCLSCRLATLFNTYTSLAGTPINPAVVGLAIPNNGSSITDTRWSMGTGWSLNSVGTFGAGSGAVFSAPAGSSGTLTFTPTAVKDDSFWIYYVSGGSSTFVASCTGGASQTLTTPSTAGEYRSAAIPCGSASTSNVLTVTPSATATTYVVGAEPFLSATSQILLGNAGVGGSRTDQWDSNAPFGGIDFIKATQPDVGVIELGINDVFNSVTLAASMAHTQAMITAVKITGDCVIATMPPAQIDPGKTLEPAYVAAEKGLAAMNGCATVDFYGRFGGVWNSLFMFDFTHPNNLGYWDWAQQVYSLFNFF